MTKDKMVKPDMSGYNLDGLVMALEKVKEELPGNRAITHGSIGEAIRRLRMNDVTISNLTDHIQYLVGLLHMDEEER